MGELPETFTVEFVGGPWNGQYSVRQSRDAKGIPLMSTTGFAGEYNPEKPIIDNFPIRHRFVWTPAATPKGGAK